MTHSSFRHLQVALAALLSTVPSDAPAQRSTQPLASTPSDSRVTDSLGRSGAKRTSSRQIPPRRRRFWFESDVTNVYDSNIEHDSTNIGSYGLVAGANGRFRTRSSRPALQLEYGVAVHSYTATDRFDRVSQLGRAGVDVPLGRIVLLGLTAEASLKGTSEDREIGDQYAILPRLELRPTDNIRFRVITAYRRRYYGESSGSNAANRYATVDTRIRFGAGRLEGVARFEENLPETERSRFERQTYITRYTWLPTDRDELQAGLEYRPVRYPGRTVNIKIIDDDGDEDEIEVTRQDKRWKPEVSWVREWTRNLRTELEYEYEMRSSNDPDKRYRGHVLTFTTAIPW